MLSDRARDIFRAAAWIFILMGPAAAIFMMFGLPGQMLASAFKPWTFALALVGAAIGPMLQGGILLALLSIDERIQNRGA